MLSNYVPCPKCGGTNIQKVGFTWWGGVLGSKLFNHVKCNTCGTTYNGKTGQSNTMNIIIYTIVVMFVVLVIAVPLLLVSNESYNFWNLRDIFLFVVFLAGIGFGISLINRRYPRVGKWTVLAFVFFIFEPIADIIINNVFARNPNVNYEILNYAYLSTNTIFTALGALAILAAIHAATKPYIAPTQPLAQ